MGRTDTNIYFWTTKTKSIWNYETATIDKLKILECSKEKFTTSVIVSALKLRLVIKKSMSWLEKTIFVEFLLNRKYGVSRLKV
jgi:hypothetical protein